MRPKLSLIIVLIFLFQQVKAQSARIDSLTEVIQKSRGTQRVDALNEYSSAIFSYDYQKAQKANHDAYQQGEQLNYVKGMAKALMSDAVIEFHLGHNSLSKTILLKSLDILSESNEDQLKGNALTYLGSYYYDDEQIDSAEITYHQAYDLLKDSTNPQYLSFLYLNLAELYEAKFDQAKQLSYLKKSWDIRIRLREKKPLMLAGIALASYYTQQGNYAESLFYLHQMQKALGKDTIDNEEINWIYREKAIIAANQGNHRIALQYFDKAKKFYEHNAYPLELTNLYSDIGYVLADVSNYETSLKYYFNALRIAESNHLNHEIAQLRFRIGWVYYLLKQTSLSEEFATKCLTLAKAHHFLSDEASALNLMGLLAMQKQEEAKALEYYNQAYAIREKNNYRVGAASTLLNMAILFEQQQEYKKAEEYNLKSLSIKRELNHAYGICESYQTLGHLYYRMKDYEKAERYLLQGEALAKKIQTASILVSIYETQRDLFKAQSKLADALHYSLLHVNLKDSLFNQRLSDRVSTIQYDFEIDKKDKEIKILNQQQELQQKKLELQQAEIKLQRLVMGIGLVIFLAISTVAYIIFRFYRKVKKLNREIVEQKEEIQAQAEELTESNLVISRINTDLEEKVLARTTALKKAYNELDTFFYRSSHDFRRPLTTFMGLAEVAKITVKDDTALELFEKVKETAHHLDKMLLKLQSVSLAGSQELIYDEVSLDAIFQSELYHFRDEIVKRSIHVSMDINLTRPFRSNTALLKIILQNLVENAVSFCSVESPEIKLKAYESTNFVVLEITDNGQGIDPIYINRVFEMYFRANERSHGNGLGLYIVKKMVEKLNGTIEIKSALNRGTTLQLYLPNNLN